MSDRFIVMSGCSRGGKSTLLAELRRRGHSVVDEPGKRIVQVERQTGGRALPWIDLAAFARRALDTATADLEAARLKSGWVFFDRGIVDADRTAITGPSFLLLRGLKFMLLIPIAGMGSRLRSQSSRGLNGHTPNLDIAWSDFRSRASSSGPISFWRS